jgi:alginate O-acetyltransferase complex protein AlgI
MIINYLVGRQLVKIRKPSSSRKLILIIGILFNVGLLGYYKYSDFFIENVNYFFLTNVSLLNFALPLAISFFTFQQIAYLVDAYKNETKEYNFLNYALFVSFFPQLIAGPIVHHKEMMPQFASNRNQFINYRNIVLGIFIFSLGLFKKVAIADTFAIWATAGFDSSEYLTFLEAWIVSLSYTFQLYFDFSGYTDMAIGIALLFNIKLPINFNSPYKALSIQEFWKRWHITLSRFLTQYIYIPLGGNRKGTSRTYINIFLVFLISGFWHGAGWTFVFWGFLHGLAMMINRYWRTFNIKINSIVAWFITFNFINVTWVFFRAETWSDALKVINGMVSVPYLHSIRQNAFQSIASFEQLLTIIMLLISVFFLVKKEPSLTNNLKPNYINIFIISIIFCISILFLNSITAKEFLYFDF